ncbi:uncharacterized protein PG986_014247 [Apiospora aurea]|uniref:Uncharacterized protein n=1 Tax=Apiospora aurea TaxID=335848 RepID=A0ABR1PSF2_9PEZI
MSFEDQDRAVDINGRSVQIPPLFSHPEPITMAAYYANHTDWRDAFDDVSEASNTSIWRSAATELTEAEEAPASDNEGTYSYLLVGFFYPGLDIGVANDRPNPTGREKAGNSTDHESEEPATAADLGLVVVPLNAPRRFYLLVDMVEGPCMPLTFHEAFIFYLPHFRVKSIRKLRWRRWNQEVRYYASSIRNKSARESFYRTLDLDMLNEIYGGLSGEDMSLGLGTEESLEEDTALFLSEESSSESGRSFLTDSEEASSESGSVMPDVMEDIPDEEEPPVESAGAPSKQEETRASSQNDADELDTNSEPASQDAVDYVVRTALELLGA